MTKLHMLLEKIFTKDTISDEYYTCRYGVYYDDLLEINNMLEFADMSGYQRHKKQLEMINDD